ncbi:MAG: response regulator transcription factor [Candidatus Kapaibacteriales bacterium]
MSYEYMDERLLPEKIEIIIADDHEVVRVGLRRIFSIDKRIFIVGEATNGLEAIDLVKFYSPRVALLDICMPKLDGIEAARTIINDFPETIVAMLTAYEDYKHIEKALSVGARAYLSKDVSPGFLLDAIYRLIYGERVFSRSILNILERPHLFETEQINENISLTPREIEVLRYIALGKTSQEIANILNISLRTVQNHRSNIMQKLGIKTAAGLVRFAVLYNSGRI